MPNIITHLGLMIWFILGFSLNLLIDLDHKGLKDNFFETLMSKHGLNIDRSYESTSLSRGLLHSVKFQILWLGITIGLLKHWMLDGVLLYVP